MARTRRDSGAWISRAPGRSSRIAAFLAPILLCAALLSGCKEKPAAPASSHASVRELFDQTVREFHAPSAEARGPERERLLSEAAKRYDEQLKTFPAETNLCAQALRALGNIHAIRGKTNEAVKLYAAVGEKYPSQDWEVLQAWKSAGDLLWEAQRREEAKKFYAQIVERFGKNDAPQIISTVVRGSKARLAE